MGYLDALKTKPMIFFSAFCSGGLITAFLKCVQLTLDIHQIETPKIQSMMCFFSMFCYRDQMQGAKFKDPIKATDKRVIITGTTSGIGKETARELAKREAHVYMACRDMEKCAEVRDEIMLESRNRHVHCMECDLSSMESIRKFVEE